MGRSEVQDIRVRLKCDPDTTIRSGSRLKFEKLTGVGGGADIGETHRWNDTLIQKHAKERATNVRDTGVWDLRENL